MRATRLLPLVVVILALGAVLGGCARQASNTAELGVSQSAPAVAPMPPSTMRDAAGKAAGAAPSAPAAAPAPESGDAIPSAADTRLIVRNGDLGIVVSDAEQARGRIQRIAEGAGGYVTNANLYRENDVLRGTVTIRVPADKFDGVLADIKGVGSRSENEHISSSDVTEEYTDLNARLRNLEATEKELLALLTTTREKSGRADDVLAVYRELTSIRADIERIKGRINFLDKSTAMATLAVTLLPSPISRPIVDEAWAPLQTVRDAFRAMLLMLQGLANAAIWVAIMGVPVLLIVGLPLAALVWLIRRWRRRPTAPTPPSPTTA
ncbi:MAG: DUF4349 domain-containing protein [Anaerolineae bacterium]